MEYKFNSKEELTNFIISEVINTSEALEILGFSRQYLSELITKGKIKPIKDLPRDRLFYKHDILNFKRA